MASLYGYLTSDKLNKAFGGNLTTYASAAGTRKYADTDIDSWITDAEKILNGFIGKSFTGTIPDDIEAATKLIVENKVKEILLMDKFIDNADIKPIAQLLDEDVLLLLSNRISTDKAQRSMWIHHGSRQ